MSRATVVRPQDCHGSLESFGPCLGWSELARASSRIDRVKLLLTRRARVGLVTRASQDLASGPPFRPEPFSVRHIKAGSGRALSGVTPVVAGLGWIEWQRSGFSQAGAATASAFLKPWQLYRLLSFQPCIELPERGEEVRCGGGDHSLAGCPVSRIAHTCTLKQQNQRCQSN